MRNYLYQPIKKVKNDIVKTDDIAVSTNESLKSVPEKFKHIKKKHEFNSEYFLDKEQLSVIIDILITDDISLFAERFNFIYNCIQKSDFSVKSKHNVTIKICSLNDISSELIGYFESFNKVTVNKDRFCYLFDMAFNDLDNVSCDLLIALSDNLLIDHKFSLNELIINYLKLFPNNDSVVQLYQDIENGVALCVGSNYIKKYLDVFPKNYFGTLGFSDLFGQSKTCNKFSSIATFDQVCFDLALKLTDIQVSFDKKLFQERKSIGFGIVDPELSILIPTVAHRRGLCLRVLNSLNEQCKLYAPGQLVEILLYLDEQEITIGEKRNKLIELARGKYVSFIDDDDFISALYVKSILDVCSNNTDAIAFRQLRLRLDKMESDIYEFRHDVPTTNDEWYNGVYKRYLSHLCPIKREIANKIKMKHLSKAEDTYWTNDIMNSGLVKTCTYIDRILYTYVFNKEVSLSP